MSNELQTINAASGSAKAFFSRPEGKVGLVVPIVALTGILYFFGSSIGDFLVNAIDNMFHLTVVGAALVGLLFVLFDPKFRALTFYIYRSIMRLITGFFIDIDPIGVLKTYKERMEGKLGEMKSALDALKGQRQKTTKRQRENNVSFENEMRLLNQAEQMGDGPQKTSAMNIHGKQASRLKQKADRYSSELDRLNLLIAIMDRYYGLCNDTIVDMDNEIKYRIEEREEARESRSAVRAALAILKGLPEKDMWDEATMRLEADYAAALGEVDNFLSMTQNILTTADLQDGADTAKALEMLDAWQAKNANVMLGGKAGLTKSAIIQEAVAALPAASNAQTINIPTAGKPQYVTVGANSGAGEDYNQFFKK